MDDLFELMNAKIALADIASVIFPVEDTTILYRATQDQRTEYKKAFVKVETLQKIVDKEKEIK